MAPRKAKEVVGEVVKPIEQAIEDKVIDTDESKLALAGVMSPGSFGGVSNFFMPGTYETLGRGAGVLPDKLVVPREYHQVIAQCYDFYQRGGIVATVINRLAELAITTITNGQRDTTDEANIYFNSVLHRKPSRMIRFIRTAALEYFLSGMVLPRIDWQEIDGKELNPALRNKTYIIPVVDLYPPKLIKVEWDTQWGKKNYYIVVPESDIRTIKRGDNNTVKTQQRRYRAWVEQYPDVVQAVRNGEKYIKIDTDAILRKETSFTEYPTPYLFAVLEALIYKQQLRRMDYSVASRVINAILLVTEGSDEFPVTEDNRGNLDRIKRQIEYYGNNPAMAQRIFPLFSNHTTKLTWITPDVTAMLDQEKYKQVNVEISEGLGLATILVTGESRNAQASEVSTWAIQPLMEELRDMFLEWLQPVYEEAARLNGFRKIPEPAFSPIRLQDFIKTAAVFAQAFKEGNISRSTRDTMMGLNFQTELELIKDEKNLITEAKLGDPESFPQMPYNVQPVPVMDGGIGGGLGRPPGAANTGGRPKGSQNVPVNNRNSGVKPKGQSPTSRVKAAFDTDEEFLEAVSEIMAEMGKVITIDDI